ncbi:PTS mannose transporter subunit IIA [Enterococcus florum]|uniref:PTS mannose transporter subunit IIA n=1 Tax=Enterococcus florum TaxID=2480627 RepID=A0A4P5P875_9ENTE|nr:PTS sugar transporter subunit IIA [Enterococcus florum]GCF92411.1 PTS mannose transporter subunit IIA [Enterococcus florum]
MVGIIVVTHDHLAQGLVDTAEAIIGKQTHVDTISVEVKANNLQDRFEEAAKRMLEKTSEIVWLVDIFGGTPFRYTSQLVLKDAKQHLVTGVNLPMLLQALANSNLTAEELTRQLELESKEAIRRI